MFNMIECPETFAEVKKLPDSIVCAIIRQNGEVASALYNNWVGEASEEAQAIPNEDAFAYLFKMRRDKLLDIVSQLTVYSWRKRAIASNILYIMGYDDIKVEGWTNV